MSFELTITDYGVVKGQTTYIDADGKVHNIVNGINAPFVEDLITLEEAKNYLKQNYQNVPLEDALIVKFCLSSRKWVEAFLNKSVIKKKIVAFTRDSFAEFTLPYPPITSITKVEKVDREGNATTLVLNTNYYEIGDQEKTIEFYHTWSTGVNRIVGIRVEYLAAMVQIPENIEIAAMQLMAENYVHRGDSSHFKIHHIPYNTKELLGPFVKFEL